MYPVALTIAGSDPSGGAGIQADLKTFMAFGVYGASVITAVTAQNTQGVSAVNPVPGEWVQGQLESVLSDLCPKSIKLGLLPTRECIRVVAQRLQFYRQQFSNAPLVLDPVGISSSGHQLAEPGCLMMLKEEILPITTLVTPNLPELAALTGYCFQSERNDHQANIESARVLLKTGVGAVLIKGGHAGGLWATDILVWADGVKEFTNKRIITKHGHGTGCTLSAAIAAGLAQGWLMTESIKKAKAYLNGASEVMNEGKDNYS
jgi:hydroxymethylpyrimidine/phosphomethylpyrimidine kinase